jgi:hypothetical protein
LRFYHKKNSKKKKQLIHFHKKFFLFLFFYIHTTNYTKLQNKPQKIQSLLESAGTVLRKIFGHGNSGGASFPCTTATHSPLQEKPEKRVDLKQLPPSFLSSPVVTCNKQKNAHNN